MPSVRPSIAVPRVPIPGPGPTPGPGPRPGSFTLTNNSGGEATQGETITFILRGANGSYDYDILGVDQSELSRGTLDGVITVRNGIGRLTIQIAPNAQILLGEDLVLSVITGVDRLGNTTTIDNSIELVNTLPPGPDPTAGFTLTTNIETLPAAGVVAGPNAVFSAPAGVTPQGVQANTLQSGDVLNGSGANNVLNATFVTNAATAPTINNIPTVNVTALADANLNLGASSGITTLGDINSTANVITTGIRTALTTLNKTGGIARDTLAISQANVLTGANNALQINLSGVDGGSINVTPNSSSNTNGYETFNVAVANASSVVRLVAGPSLDNINVSGGALEIEGLPGVGGAGGFAARNAIEEGVRNFNASAMTGALIVGSIDNGAGLTEGASVVNAAQEDLSFIGSNNGTTLYVESASLGQGDNLFGGTGTADTLVLTGASGLIGANQAVQGNNSAFAAAGFETLAITDTRGDGVGQRTAINPAAFNLANVSGVKTVQLGTASSTVVGLTNLQYTSPLAINVTGNGEQTVNAGNGVNAVFFGAFGDADTVNYTFGNKGRTINNNNGLTLGQLSLPNIENVNLTFNDLNSNTRLSYNAFGSNAGNATSLFANSGSVRFVTVNSQSGDDANGSIVLGTIGSAATVRGAEINSNAGVTATFRNRGGASFSVTGAGDHRLTVDNINDGEDSTINGNSGTGDQIYSVLNPVTDSTVPVVASAGRALFTGGSGDDTLIGGGANDVLTGNSGADVLSGNSGIDVLSGGDNNDLLIGGYGADVLTGDGGVDTFRFANQVQIVGGVAARFTSADADNITDFNVGAGGDILSVSQGIAAGQVANLTATLSTFAAPVDNSFIVDATDAGFTSVTTATAAIQAAAGGAAPIDDYVVIFRNTTSGRIEAYVDGSSALLGDEVQIVTGFNTANAAAFLAGFTAANTGITV